MEARILPEDEEKYQILRSALIDIYVLGHDNFDEIGELYNYFIDKYGVETTYQIVTNDTLSCLTKALRSAEESIKNKA